MSLKGDINLTEEKIKNSECEPCEVTEETVENEAKSSESLEKIEPLKEELSSQKEKFLRLAAEYDNYRKRSEKDKISIYSDAKAKTIAEILPIADCIERAIESSKDANDEYQKGLIMLRDQFNSSLSKLSVQSFGDIGDKFNPEIHNAISHVENNELEENVIAQVFQKGYRLDDKIIRHAMVSVAN